jgi:hypothetical protein
VASDQWPLIEMRLPLGVDNDPEKLMQERAVYQRILESDGAVTNQFLGRPSTDTGVPIL